jgi:hypothetical protein
MTTKTDLPTELESIASDEKLMQIARKAIEDELVEWRDECRFMMRNNGFAIRNRDGSSSTIIRFGSEATEWQPGDPLRCRSRRADRYLS